MPDITPNPENTLHIKNMVCNRCIMVVKSQLEQLGLHPLSVELGIAVLPDAVSNKTYQRVKDSLETFGFELIVECRTVTELAQVILVMQENELKITPEEMVKERFIRLFLPITPRITKGKSVSNIRARINDAWSSRLRHRSTGRF